ncbi:hypothetical protein [Ornithinibacillus bavariensis]|uniref:Ribosomal protein L7/L12 C-terminal domain-containing protein n=1 Tax=Ornithinibacillus bavariensis TaxID=545502 RepID=A0A920C6T9_9BACI|nr:hypothetical protein [Ornithinibacillus bavariensis]GIO26022.1 hypothetical protein J43TS3_06330 [Ornithinibacillus bavariensis]
MEINCAELLILFIVLYLLNEVVKLNSRVKGLKYTLDKIYKQADVPNNALDNELKQLLNEGKDVKGVKRARETLGLSLIEAKQYVDALKMEGS